mgnify:CR=1 FL=1
MSFKNTDHNARKYSEPDKEKTNKGANLLRQTMDLKQSNRYKTEKSFSDNYSEEIYIKNNSSTSFMSESRKSPYIS